MEKETLEQLKERYGKLLHTLIEFKHGMSSHGSVELGIPKCPICPKQKTLEYCQTQCEWAKIFKRVCKKIGGEGFSEYLHIIAGINQAMDGFNYILHKLDTVE